METLEERKAKFNKHLQAAEAFEEDDEMDKAIRAYQLALKFSLHKKDTDAIQAKIARLKNMAGYVSGMLSDDGKSSASTKTVLIVSLIVLVLVSGVVMAWVLKLI